MNSLAFTPPSPKQTLGATPVTIVSEQDEKPQYPTISLNGSQAESAGLTTCAHGDEYEITIRIRAKRIGGWEYPGSGNENDKPAMEFDVISASDPVKVKEEIEEDEDKGKTRKKAKGVKTPKDSGLTDAYEDD